MFFGKITEKEKTNTKTVTQEEKATGGQSFTESLTKPKPGAGGNGIEQFTEILSTPKPNPFAKNSNDVQSDSSKSQEKAKSDEKTSSSIGTAGIANMG